MLLHSPLNTLLSISLSLLCVSATPQLSLFARQQSSSTSSLLLEPSQTFSTVLLTQCYTSQVATQPSASPTTSWSTRLVSVFSTTTSRTTSIVTPVAATTSTTNVMRITSTVTNPTIVTATITSTNTRLITTITTTTRTTGTTSVSTTSTTTTLAASPNFTPVQSSLPTSGSNQPGKRDHCISLPNSLEPRQRGGRPRNSFGRNRPRSYPGNISCLAVIGTGTIATRARTLTSTLQTPTVTSTITSTSVITILPSARMTTTITTLTSSTITFRITRTTTTTDTTFSTSTSTFYAACASPTNRVSRINNRPIDFVVGSSDLEAYSGDSASAYACCVSAIINPLAALWAFSPNPSFGCLILMPIGATGMCPNGQAGGTTNTAYTLSDSTAADEFTVGNAYCGTWNAVNTGA